MKKNINMHMLLEFEYNECTIDSLAVDHISNTSELDFKDLQINSCLAVYNTTNIWLLPLHNFSFPSCLPWTMNYIY